MIAAPTGFWRYLPRLAGQGLRLLTLPDFHFLRSGWAFPPVSVNFELTVRCNLQCRMCWLWGEHRVGASFVGEELDTATVLRTIDDLARYRPFIYLQGGEVLLRKDLPLIMQRLSARHLIFGFTTNGTLITNELAEAIVRYAGAVSISLDGPEMKHDSVRGTGSFQRTCEGIRRLVAVRGKARRPVIKLNALATSLAGDEMQEIVRLGTELKVDVVKFGDLQFLTPERAAQHKKVMKQAFDIDCRSIDGYVAMPELDIAQLWKNLRAVGNCPGVETWRRKSFEALRRWYQGTVSDSYRYCFFPWFSAMIRADGSVVPCGEYRHPEYSLGNVRSEPFSRMWNGVRMRRFRQVLRENGFFPGCDRCCGLESFARQKRF